MRAALEQVFHPIMPESMGFSYQGMSYQEQRAAEGIPAWVVFGLSLLFVFLILAALYESWTLPFSVLLSTPVAILGAYLALSLRSLENDIFATVGLIMLIGLSAKNAILIVEFAVSNYGAAEYRGSALDAARLRFRPIVMTALAFIFGCLPLWTASGSGAVSRRILGTVVIGGMSLATLIGILMIPVTFAVVEYLSHRFGEAGGALTMDSPHPSPNPGRVRPRGRNSEGPHRKRSFPRGARLSLCRMHRRPALLASRMSTRPPPIAARMIRDRGRRTVSLGDRLEHVFPEPELQDLIRTALADNYDLRIAAERILEQEAQVRIIRAQQFPSLNVGGTGAGADLPSSAGSSIGSPLSFGSFNVSGSWAPDFWGLYRKQTEAARDQLLAQTWAQRAVRLSLVQQVVTTYIDLRALDRQLAIARDTLKPRQESVDLTRGSKLPAPFRSPTSAGRRTSLHRRRADSAVRTEIQQQENDLQLLLGHTARTRSSHGRDALRAPAGPAGRPALPAAGTPSGHPAVRAAIGCGKRADRRGPRAVLSADLASAHPPASAAIRSRTSSTCPADTIYGIGSLTQPIFAGGKLRGQLQLARNPAGDGPELPEDHCRRFPRRVERPDRTE